MKRNFEVVVTHHDGRPHVRQVFKYEEKTGLPVLKDGAHEFDKFMPMTLRQYAIDALAGRWKGEENMSRDDAWKRMKLHDKIAFNTDGAVELTADEGKMILDALDHMQASPIVIGRMKDLIDTDPEV